MRVLVTGSRWYENRLIIHAALRKLPANAIIVQGGARGADLIALQEARALKLRHETHFADWERYGKLAGSIRNQEMLESGIDIALAFHDSLAKSRGTLDMVRRLVKAGVPTTLYHGDKMVTITKETLAFYPPA